MDILYENEKLEEEPEVFDGIAKNRESTNRPIFILMVIVLLVTVGFVSYSIATGKIARIEELYDDCGNLCGEINPPNSILKLPCTNLDLTSKKNVCREKNMGISWNIFELDIPWGKIFACTGISFALTILQLLLFCKATKYYVWFTIIFGVALNIVICVICWIIFAEFYNKEYNNKRQWVNMLMFTTVITVSAVCLLILIFILFNRIKLLIMLFKEAFKVLIEMPLIVLQSLYAIIVLALVTSLFVYFTVTIWSTMSLKPVENTDIFASQDKYEYSIGALQIVGFAINYFTFLWMWQFVIDCQYFVVASSVSKWFFTRDKSRLESPILSSFKILVVYHLGTVALGSLLITLIRILRMLIRILRASARRNIVMMCIGWCVECFVAMFEHYLRIITKNAYIVTAIYGYSFMSAGKKAFHLLTSNFKSTIAIDSTGNTVLYVSKFLVVLISGAIGYVWLSKQDYNETEFITGLPLIVLFSYAITNSFFDIIGITVDAIFLCFCIDMDTNDGVERPYFMTIGLMTFMEEGKKYVALKEEEKDREREVGA